MSINRHQERDINKLQMLIILLLLINKHRADRGTNRVCDVSIRASPDCEAKCALFPGLEPGELGIAEVEARAKASGVAINTVDASVAAAAAAENAASMANGESRVVDPELREPVISRPKGTDSLMFAGNKKCP